MEENKEIIKHIETEEDFPMTEKYNGQDEDGREILIAYT